MVNPDDKIRYEAVGVVSSGLLGAACSVRNYQRYTDVAHYHTWIKEVVMDAY